MTLYRTRDRDTLDHVCWRHYGRQDVVTAVYEANPGLAGRGPVLPAGLEIELPELPEPTPKPYLRLWD